VRVADVPDFRLGLAAKLRLAALVWLEYGLVLARVRRISLPDLVRHLETTPHRVNLQPLDPRRLGRFISRTLNRGPFHSRCLTLSLVHFRMLVRQGTKAQLVVGLPSEPANHDAHAWVEVGGKDVGPPPGRLGHKEMVRYGSGESPRR
jgi:hypothetical protein